MKAKGSKCESIHLSMHCECAEYNINQYPLIFSNIMPHEVKKRTHGIHFRRKENQLGVHPSWNNLTSFQS